MTNLLNDVSKAILSGEGGTTKFNVSSLGKNAVQITLPEKDERIAVQECSKGGYIVHSSKHNTEIPADEVALKSVISSKLAL